MTMVAAGAAIFANQMRRDLTVIEQSLTILQSSSGTNPEQLSVARWKSVPPVLGATPGNG